jgi:hypothetical protein
MADVALQQMRTRQGTSNAFYCFRAVDELLLACAKKALCDVQEIVRGKFMAGFARVQSL